MVQTLNKINKRSNYDENEKNEEHVKAPDDFLLPGSVCALAAANNSVDTLWFVQIKGEFESTTSVSDDYGHIVTPGQKYMLGHFLEQVSDQITSKTYKLIDKETIFYRESVVYPFVNVTEKKGKYIISSRDYIDIINFVEHNG